jgi:hypothetical protein
MNKDDAKKILEDALIKIKEYEEIANMAANLIASMKYLDTEDDKILDAKKQELTDAATAANISPVKP